MFLALLMFLFLLMNMFLVSFYPVPCHALPFRPERKDLSDLSHIHKSLNWWVHFIFHSCCCSVYSPWHLKPSSQMCRRSDNLFHFISFLHLIFSFPPCHLVSNTRNATSRIRGESLSCTRQWRTLLDAVADNQLTLIVSSYNMQNDLALVFTQFSFRSVSMACSAIPQIHLQRRSVRWNAKSLVRLTL